MNANSKGTWQVPTERAGEALASSVIKINAASNSAVQAGAAIALGLFRLAEAIEYAADRSSAIDERPLGVRKAEDGS